MLWEQRRTAFGQYEGLMNVWWWWCWVLRMNNGWEGKRILGKGKSKYQDMGLKTKVPDESNPWTHQTCLYLRAFALALLRSETLLPRTSHGVFAYFTQFSDQMSCSIPSSIISISFLCCIFSRGIITICLLFIIHIKACRRAWTSCVAGSKFPRTGNGSQ